MYDDFLQLAGQSFEGVALVAFVGRSGSGKSTAMESLEAEHPAFAVADRLWVRSSGELHTMSVPETASVLFVDEVRTPRDVDWLWRAARTGARLVVASHVKGWKFLPFRRFGRVRVFRTDVDSGKLERNLTSRGVTFSSATIQKYVATYGATFTDLDIIMERSGGLDFDRALSRFEAFDRLTISDDEPPRNQRSTGITTSRHRPRQEG